MFNKYHIPGNFHAVLLKSPIILVSCPSVSLLTGGSQDNRFLVKSLVSIFQRAKCAVVLGLLVLFVTVPVFAGWQLVGNPGFSIGDMSWTVIRIAIDSNDIPYVAYGGDSGTGGKATVMKFNGSSWENVGNTGFSQDAVGFIYNLIVDSNNTPYIAYRDATGLTVVTKFSGNSWIAVSNGITASTSIVLDSNDTLWATTTEWINGSGYKTPVMKFNGTIWETVGNIGINGGADPSLALDSSNVPYVAYRDYINGVKATVMKFNGNNWEIVGNAGFSEGTTQAPTIAIDSNNIIYMAYEDLVHDFKTTVMKFNGSNWETVGNSGFSAGWAGPPINLTFDSNDMPYVAYCDNSTYGGNPGTYCGNATVMRYNGNLWETVGDAGFSGHITTSVSLALDSHDVPYVAYQDYTNGNKPTVMRFVPTAEINVKQTTTDILDGSSIYDFGNVNVGSTITKIFTVDSTGDSPLNLTGNPPVVVTGNGFSVTNQPTSPVAATGSTAFVIQFAPTVVGTVTGTVNIANNDSDENPYNFNITGTGIDATPPTYTVTLTITGTGTGTITGNGSFNAGVKVSLSVTPTNGSTFMGWEPAPCATNFTMPARNLTCTAKFETKTPNTTTTSSTPLPEKLSLTVQVEGAGRGQIQSDTGLFCRTEDCTDDLTKDTGTVCQVSCSQILNALTTVTLTPTAETGSFFSSWGGHPDCAKGPMLMNSSKLCIAYFRKLQTQLSLTIVGNGQGQIKVDVGKLDWTTDKQGQATYDYGSKVTLTAIANSNSSFTGWEGSSDCNDSQVEMNENQECIARFTLNQSPQTITFNTLPAKTYGTAPFTVTATASSGLPVSFSGTGNCTITGNTVTLTGVGNCTIATSQAGDANYSAATSVAQTFTISEAKPTNKAKQIITFEKLSAKVYGEVPFTVTATASSGLPVGFSGTGNCTVADNTVTITGVGSCTVIATQAGDANYQAAPNVARTFTINQIKQTITFSALPAKVYGDAPFTISATASSGLPVSFSSTGNCSLTGNIVTLIGAGSCTITATQAGNATYSAAINVAQTFTINKAKLNTTPSVETSPTTTTVVPTVPVTSLVPIVPTTTAAPVTPIVPTTPEVSTTPAVPVPVAVVQLPPPPPCPTQGSINLVCNADGQTIKQAEVQPGGQLSNGTLDGTLTSQGWVSNLSITTTGKLVGGVVTGYIKNQGVMMNFEFRGLSITGGTLGGVILDTSTVGGYFQDVTLLANTKITGGRLKGKIVGDINAPALLENLTIMAGSQVTGVKLGKLVKVEKGAKVTEVVELKLPSLGSATAHNAKGEVVATKTQVSGGITVDGKTFKTKVTVKTTQDTVTIRSRFQIDSAHVGSRAEMVTYFAYQTATMDKPVYLMKDSHGGLFPWDEKPETLIASKTNVTLPETLSVDLYQGVFLTQGNFKFHFGYRLTNGSIVENTPALELEVMP